MPAAFLVDRAYGREVTILARMRTPAEREAWRTSGWDVRDGVAELYGIVEPPEGLRVLVTDEERLLHPPEQPGLALLPLDRAAGEDVLTVRAFYGRAAVFAAGFFGLAILLALFRRLRRSPQRVSAQRVGAGRADAVGEP